MAARIPCVDVARYQDARGAPCRLEVFAGLHFIKGNKAPYFSVTGVGYESGRESFGGCCHDEIERRFPGRFSDLIALHLSDIDGAPMYAVENASYYAIGGTHLGAQWLPAHGPTYGTPVTPDGRVDMLARHLRCDRDTATRLRDLGDILRATHATAGPEARRARQDAGAELRRTVEAMRPRWRAEADRAIARHKLADIHGDALPPEFSNAWRGMLAAALSAA